MRRLQNPIFGLSIAWFALAMGGPAHVAGQFGAGGDPFGGVQTPEPRVTFEARWSADGVRPGEQVLLAVTADMAEGWHIQVHRPSEDRMIPTELELRGLPAGASYGDIQWPEPKAMPYDLGDGPSMFDFYVDGATFFVKVSVPGRLEPGRYDIVAAVYYQACDDSSCLQARWAELPLTLNVVGPDRGVEPRHAALFERYAGRGNERLRFDVFGWGFTIDPGVTWLLLSLAALGGFLLNLTPCVLPLIPIKVMGLTQHAGGRARAVAMGLVMSIGVVAFWVGIGAAIAFAAGFDAVNELFQRDWFTIGVGAVVGVMGLGMWGLFTARLPQWVYKVNPSQDTPHGAFGFGVMTAVLSTPCTAPFMGTAAAWAAGADPATSLATFAAIGGGMALPYLVLTLFPRLVARVPRTGPASELVKQVMGLLMLAAGAFFVGTGLANRLNTPPDPVSDAYWWPVGAFVVLAGLWLGYRTWRITGRARPRAAFTSIAALLVAVGVAGAVALTRPSPVDWVYYTPERLAEAERRDRVVVLEFTANWCLNCHALERAVLYKPRVAEALNAPGVAPIKVDISKHPPAQRLLEEVGSKTIPLLIVRDRDGDEVFRSEAYSVDNVLAALRDAGATDVAGR